MFQNILIRFGELSLKGKNKMNFVNILAQNIRKICNVEHKNMVIHIDRIFIPFSTDNLKNLNYVFGISSFSPVIKVNSDLSIIEKKLLEINLDKYSSFKINCRRKWKKIPMNSMELNQYFGNLILNNNENLKVKVKEADIEINIEIHEDFAYIFWEKMRGLGGLPANSSGKVLHLLSGGIDSPIAALEMIKRGVKVNFLSFISPPHTDEMTIKKIKMIISELTKYQIESKLFLFNYTNLMNYIGLTSNQSYKIVLMRRSFYRIADSIARKFDCLGISNGENLGQVASQTLEAMNTIHSQTNLPIYQPLLTNDKIETITKSEKFNLFKISVIKACETCEIFAPNHPITKPNNEIAMKLENELDMLKELEKKSLDENVEIYYFNNKEN